MLYTKHNHIMYVLSYCSYQHNHILQLLTIRLPYFFKFIRQLLRGFFSQICLNGLGSSAQQRSCMSSVEGCVISPAEGSFI